MNQRGMTLGTACCLGQHRKHSVNTQGWEYLHLLRAALHATCDCPVQLPPPNQFSCCGFVAFMLHTTKSRLVPPQESTTNNAHARSHWLTMSYNISHATVYSSALALVHWQACVGQHVHTHYSRLHLHSVHTQGAADPFPQALDVHFMLHGW